MKFLTLFLVALGFVTLPLFGDDAITNSGVSFPSKVTINANGKEYTLNETGTSTRKKFFVKIYVIASYLDVASKVNASNKFEAFTNDAYAKQLTFKFVHEVSVDKIREAYSESLNNIDPNLVSQLQGEIQKFIGFFNEPIPVGEEQIFRWLPGGNVEILINGKKVGNITNKAFAQALWSIWLGDKSVVNRDDLTSLIK